MIKWALEFAVRRATNTSPISASFHSMISFCVAIGCLLVGVAVFAATTSPTEERMLEISWRVLPGRSGELPDVFMSEIILSNKSDQTLGNSGWQLYFNFCRKVTQELNADALRIVHVNGDLYRLEPRQDFEPFRPGTTRAFQFETDFALIKETDAPSGFFLVLDDEIRQRRSVVSLGEPSIDPNSLPKNLARSRDDRVAVPTLQSRYLENLEIESAEAAEARGIVPTPVSFQQSPGEITINRDTQIVADSQLRREATYLAESLQPILGEKLRVRDPADAPATNSIVLSLGEVTVEGKPRSAGEHAYELTVETESGIAIVGTAPAGVFYGIQSLRALLPIESYRQVQTSVSVREAKILDAPLFPYRGMHLDVARNFQSEETIKKFLELMAFYKLNKFHFHLTDDEGWRLEIKGLPELTEIGGKRLYSVDETDGLLPSFGSGPDAEAPNTYGSGHYSREEFIEILRFAAQRHIEVIPEIDLPGHARAAIRAMEVRYQRRMAEGKEDEAREFRLIDPADTSQYESVQLWHDNVIDVDQVSTYKFVDHVLSDIREMYTEAGLELRTIHLGVDEVPEGVWQKSLDSAGAESGADNVALRKEAMSRFVEKVAQSFARGSGVVTGVWEEVFLNDLRKAQAMNDPSQNRFAGADYQCYVWNNVWGWGQEDAAYRLANAGVNVVLCNATHLYFDLAYNKDPREPGYYWAGFVDTKTPFTFTPLNYLAKTRRDIHGQVISWDSINRRVRLNDKGKKHVLGIQGQLWAENLKGQDQLEYMALPKLIALAERAWAKEPEWMADEDPDSWPRRLRTAWSAFSRQLASTELPRLDYLSGGYRYRIPEAGAIIENGVLQANSSLPGWTIRYTTDGSVPNSNSPVYSGPVNVGTKATVRLYASDGRGGRPSTVEEKRLNDN